MNRITTTIAALLLTVGLTALATACADDDDKQNDPSAQTSELTDAEKKAAQTQQTPSPVDPSTSVAEHTSLVKSCDTCGPLPDPWAKGPLPDPWAQGGSSSSGTSTSTGTGGTDTGGHK